MSKFSHVAIAAFLTVVTGALPSFAADLSAIKQKGVLSALTTGNDKPNVYMDPTGKPVGFEVDMCNMIASKLGVKLDLGVLAWEGLLPTVAGAFRESAKIIFNAALTSLLVPELDAAGQPVKTTTGLIKKKPLLSGRAAADMETL